MISYEWVFEEYDKNGDIVDPLFSETLWQALQNTPDNPNNTVGIALVKNIGDNEEGLTSREYAYLKNNKLSDEFDDGYKIPKRFHDEVIKNLI